jgi:feruloyl esterase
MLPFVLICAVVGTAAAEAQQASSCTDLTKLKLDNVEITSAVLVPAGPNHAQGFGGRATATYAGNLSEHCRVDGVIGRRKGVDGVEYGIGFALALPDNWNGDFMMQGGGGANGIIRPPLGASFTGDTPALVRGFAVASTDTGHKAKTGEFDFTFTRDQQAYLDFAYLANAEVAGLTKQIIARYYSKPAAYSYFVGCSTGGREGMILSQRYPTVFNGIVSGDPAMRTGFSNLAISRWIPTAFNLAAPRDASGKPEIDKLFRDNDRKLFVDALLKECDGKDGLADGMISNPMACDFDPAVLACKGAESASCIAPEKVAAIKKAFAGPTDSRGYQVYPGFPYDTGVTSKIGIPGLLAPTPQGIFGPYPTAIELDVDKAALHASDPLVEPASTNMTTFSGSGGKLIFFHGMSDPWFSPLDTLGYYKSLAETNGGVDKVAQWSQIYLIPGMSHCRGGPSRDQFDMLNAVVNWVEKGIAPKSVIATGRAFPGRSRPLCPYPQHAQYKGSGNTEDASNFQCQ